MQKDHGGNDIVRSLDQSIADQERIYKSLHDKYYDDTMDVLYKSKQDITQSKFLNDYIQSDYESNIRYLKNVL